MRQIRRRAIATAALLAVPSLARAGTAVTYTGPNDGYWSNPANWSGGVVPNNSTYDVTIPSNVNANYDLGTPTTIESLNTGGNSSVLVTSTSTLTVTGQVGGTVNADGGSFVSSSTQAGILDDMFIYASSGGTFNFSTSTYTASGYGNNIVYDMIAASGPGSVVNGTALTTLSVYGNQGNSQYQVHASNGGTINLPQLLAVTYTYGNNNDYLNFVTDYGGTINLPELASVNQFNFDTNFGTQQLPALLSASYGGFFTGNSAVINAPLLNTITSVTVTPGTNGTFNAPSLSTATDSTLNYQPHATLITGPLGDIDYSRLLVTNNTSVNSVSASSYTIGNGYYGNNNYFDVFAAGGNGSALNLSSITTITVNGNNEGNDQFQVHAYNGGVINLNGLTTVNFIYGGGSSYLSFIQDPGSTIQLNKLNNVNQALFTANSGTLSLPSLVSASNTGFATNNGASIYAPNLTVINDVTLQYPLNLTTGMITNFDNSRILVSAGVTVSSFNASSYTVGNGQYGNNNYFDVLSASGTGANLNLSSLSTITVNGNNEGNDQFQVHAYSGGTINLSGLTSVGFIYGGGSSYLSFIAETNGSINASGLRSVTQTLFTTRSGGSITLGDISSTYYSAFETSDANGKLIFNGGLVLDSTSTLALAPLSSLTIPGRISFATTNPGQFQASSAIVHVTGSDVQTVEAGGFDNGPAVYGTQGNFGFGQFVVGSATQSSVVELVQLYNNGGTAGSQALYCYGLGGGGSAGLVMNSGSLMAIGGYNVYVNENGTLVNLQNQFPAGSNIMPYSFNGSNGFILKTLALAPDFYATAVNNGNQDTWSTGNGSWDTAGNWSFGITPSSNLEAVVTPAVGAIVTGPASGATVNTLIVDNTGAAATVLKLNSATATVTVTGGLEVGSAGIINLAAGTLNVGSTLTIGTVQTQPGTTYITSTILNQGGMTLGGTTTAGAVVNNGTIELSAGTHTFGPLVGPGTLLVDAGATLSAERVRQTIATINGTVAVRPQAGTDVEVSRVTTLNIGPGGRFDIADNPMVLDSGTLTAVAAMVNSAYAGGAWTGPGLTSSLAGAASRTGVGYTTAALAGVTSWNGETVSPTDILVQRTLLGDVNLDGTVNIQDFNILASHFGESGAGINWSTGDFNNDGVVNISDFNLLSQNFGATLLPDGTTTAPSIAPDVAAQFAADLAVIDADLAAGIGTAAPAPVPEPASAALLAAACLAARRRRR